MAGASEIPMLEEGRRYLLLAANSTTTGFWSGIVDNYVFAIEDLGTEVLVGWDGRVLQEISLRGPRFGGVPLFESPRHDGVHFPAAARLTSVASEDLDAEVARAITVTQAAKAIVDAAFLEGIEIGGTLASPDPPGASWQGGPAAPSEPEGDQVP
jgi:hypothetical protein